MKLFALLALVALPAFAQTWEGKPGTVYRITGAPDWYQVLWGNATNPDAAGNLEWRHLPVEDFHFRAVRVIWTAGVPVAQRKDGSCIVLRTSAPTPCPGATVAVPPVVVAPPPPVVTPPPVVVPPLPTVTATRERVLVVPIQYPNDLGYASKVTKPALEAVFAQVSAWWLRESYGQRALDVTVLPEVKSSKPHPGCSGQITNDAIALAGYGAIYPDFANGYHPELGYAVHVYVTTPGCWSGHMETGGNSIWSYSIYPDSVGKFIHELGHAHGFGHTGYQAAPGATIATYGSWYDQMGVGGASTAVAHFNAFHKSQLRVLTAGPCADTTLRDLAVYPDAIVCPGVFSTFAEYHDDGTVWIHQLKSGGDATWGLDDNVWVAQLRGGQGWSDGKISIGHLGGGRIVAKVLP